VAAAEITSRMIAGRQFDPIEVPLDAAVLGGVALVMTLATVAMVPAATAWHRLILWGPAVEPGHYRLGRRELRYGLYLLAYCALIIATAAPVGGTVFYGALGLVALGIPIGFDAIEPLLEAATAAGMAIALFATVRLFLLFPDVAIGSAMKLREAGRASRGNQLRLFVASMIPMGPVVLIRLATETPADAGWALVAMASAVASALLVPFLAASVSVLSLSYRVLCRPHPEPAPAPG
jgi:hypothetical protein